MKNLFYVSALSLLATAMTACQGRDNANQNNVDSISVVDSVVVTDTTVVKEVVDTVVKTDTVSRVDTLAKAKVETTVEDKTSKEINRLLSQMSAYVKKVKKGDSSAAMKATQINGKLVSKYYNKMTPAQKKKLKSLQQWVMG